MIGLLIGFEIYVLIVCAFLLGAILGELEKIRKALTRKVVVQNVTLGREHAP